MAAGLFIILLLVLYLFRALIPPFAVAVLLAYIVKPVADRVERRLRLSRTLSVLLVYLVILVLIALVPVTVVPLVVDRVTRLNIELQTLSDQIILFLSQPVHLLDYTFSLEQVVGDVQTALQSILRPFATQTVGFFINLISSLLWVISIFIISFYLVRDAARLRTFLDSIAPPGYTEELRQLREEMNQVWKAFLRGQVVLGLVVGTVVWVAMSIVGLPNAGLMALIAGLLEIVPTFGPVLATIPALITALLQGSVYLPLSNFWFAVLVLGIYVIIQQTENAYLVPRIMGRRLQLHPLVVFLGVLAGGLVAGVVGVLLAAPVMGTLRVLARYMYAKLLDQAPFPPEFVKDGEVYPGEIDAILFDLDGTLVETDDDAVDWLARRLSPIARILPGRNAMQSARRVIMAFEGPSNGLLTLLDKVGLDDDVLGLGDKMRSLRGMYTPINFRQIDGISDALCDLSRRYHLAIVTTRSREHAQVFVKQFKLDGVLHAITGREDTWRLKPHPGPILHAAEQLGVPVERCLMVGDTTVDILAAHAAGARSVGVLSGFGDAADLERAGADMVVDTAADLAKWM
ncbi:MAG: AI-2E family transporter [Anaerolineae bacterium]|nr:AI-2E family transporter [Anaerolineae bacterium]